jgi:hypothetical protein
MPDKKYDHLRIVDAFFERVSLCVEQELCDRELAESLFCLDARMFHMAVTGLRQSGTEHYRFINFESPAARRFAESGQCVKMLNDMVFPKGASPANPPQPVIQP